MISATLNGFLLALGLIIPLGPQNLFVLSQGAVQPLLRSALPAVLTTALADTALICFAVMGVSVALLSVPGLRDALLVGGVLFLTWMGVSYLRVRPEAPAEAGVNAAWSRGRQIRFALSVSLLNPHAILDTVGVIGTASSAYHGASKVGFTLACVGTSWIWFLALATLGRRLGSARIGSTVGHWIHRAAGVAMLACAALLIAKLK